MVYWRTRSGFLFSRPSYLVVPLPPTMAVNRGYLRSIKANFNAYLAFCVIILGVSSCNQAFETNSISTTQAMPYFIKQFGDCDAQGNCILPTSYLALLNCPYPFLCTHRKISREDVLSGYDI